MKKRFSKKKIKFGLVQYAIGKDPQVTLKRVFHLMNRLSYQKPDYLVLPEMWLGGPQRKEERENWIQFYGKALDSLKSWCTKNHIGCFFSQFEKKGNYYYNTAHFIDEQGHLRGRYRKIHLFSYGGETKIYTAGSQIVTFQTPFGKMGCVICYDIRFPELIRTLANRGIKILVVCAQWPENRIRHWLTLLEARAIENQIFVVAVNRLGKKDKNRYRGHSVVFNPWGELLLYLKASQKIGITTLDLAQMEKIRRQYPFFKERKLALK